MAQDRAKRAGWMAHMVAFAIDAALIWGIAALVAIVPLNGHPGSVSLALAWLFAALAAATWMHGRGTTPGTRVAGFRYRTHKGELPGWKFGGILTFIRLDAAPLCVLFIWLSGMTGDELPDLKGYPLVTEKTRAW